MITHPSTILKKIYPSLVWNIPTKKKELFLTFDDGPTPIVTESLLDLLAKYNAKATFFCIGENVSKYPSIFNRILAEDHSIGNHTFNHLNGWKTKTLDYLHNAFQFGEYYKTELFRPPYGKIKASQIKGLKGGYKIIMWSVLSMDFHPRYSKEKCLETCTKEIKSGDIIVFHDSLKAKNKMLFCVERILEKYQNDFEFNSIDLSD